MPLRSGNMSFLTDFESVRPWYEASQADTLEWILAAHFKAESANPNTDIDHFHKTLRTLLYHVACKPPQIEKRGHSIRDALHRNWSEMDIYTLDAFPQGIPLEKRMEVYKRIVDPLFETLYEKCDTPPHHLIHVSCTGYISPSAPQRLVSKRGWGNKTTITHAYHMGCYGSIPALRMGTGYLSHREKADIVHTEVCSIHGNPTLHTVDQLIGQSLFADGFIKYSVSNKAKNSALKILAIHEEVIPSSLEAMTWTLTEWNFRLSLSKEIPSLIANTLKKHLDVLCQKGKCMPSDLISSSIFAVHPGGPKILQQVQDLLGCADHQLHHSRQVLKAYGNMSSATLPHIWHAICQDASIAEGTKIISFAFGPGLFLGSVLLEKRSA